jgi:hypothetical protein
MAGKRFTAEQIIIKLREAEVELAKGQPPAEVCRKLGVTEQTYYRWRQEYNVFRPHSALGYRPPAPEAITPLPPGSAPLHPSAMAVGLT